jgi:hypothetical protein
MIDRQLRRKFLLAEKGPLQLEALSLSYSGIGDAGATTIAGSLKDLSQLQTLNLRYNSIGDAKDRSV